MHTITFFRFSSQTMVTAAQQDRSEFAKLFWSGNSFSVIGRTMRKQGRHIPISTLKDWAQRLQSNQALFLSGRRRKRLGNSRANRKGAPPLSLADKRRIQDYVRAHPEQALRTDAAHLPQDINASYSTVRRERIKAGVKPLHIRRKPKLDKTQRKKRREFAKANLNTEWALVVLSDEFTCSTAGSYNPKHNVYYTDSPKHVPSRPTTKYNATMSFMAVLTSQGPLPLVECPVNPTADQFQRVLETIVPQLNAKLGHEYIFLHDLSPAFTATSTQQYLEENVPAFFSRNEYPPNSPDINAIENVLGQVKEYVGKARPRNSVELLAAVREGWSRATTPENVAALFGSMPARVRAVVAAKGGRTRF